MPDDKRQRYIAYRAAADEYQVHFYGGPLDGARIITDILPETESFLHCVNGRSYRYRYRRVSADAFHATFDHSQKAKGRADRQIRSGPRLGLGLSLIAVTAALLLMGWWSLRQ